MKKNGHSTKATDDFIAPARRAFRRVASKLRAENTRLGLPLLVKTAPRTQLTKSGTSA